MTMPGDFGMVPGTWYKLKICWLDYFLLVNVLWVKNKELKLYSECFKMVGKCDPLNIKQ